jgi:hypothetical protein
MKEELDLSTSEGQKKFYSFKKEVRKDHENISHDLANEMTELTGENSTSEDYDIAFGLVGEKDKEDYKKIKKDFDSFLKDKFEYIPENIKIKSNLKGVDSISLLSPCGENKNMTIVANYPVDRQTRNGDNHKIMHHFSFYIDNKGGMINFHSSKPKELEHITSKEMMTEVLDISQKLGFDSSWMTDEVHTLEVDPDVFAIDVANIVPFGETDKIIKSGDGSWEEASIDRDRFEFLRRQPDCIGELRSQFARGGGDKEYFAFLFRRGMILENMTCENRLFYYRFDNPISNELINQIKNRELEEADVWQRLEEQGIHQLVNFDKGQLERAGAIGKRHPSRTADKSTHDFWIGIQNIINDELV